MTRRWDSRPGATASHRGLIGMKYFHPPADRRGSCPERKLLGCGRTSAMHHKKIAMSRHKRIALVAHDNQKWDLVQWAKYNRDLLAQHHVSATGTTGRILEE